MPEAVEGDLVERLKADADWLEQYAEGGDDKRIVAVLREGANALDKFDRTLDDNERLRAALSRAEAESLERAAAIARRVCNESYSPSWNDACRAVAEEIEARLSSATDKETT